ncbi:MAG: hypothetical protein WD065_14360 [Planctomycetaceae bacterium]
MLPIKLTVAPNSYPMISVDPPWELFGDFLSIEWTAEKASRVLNAVESVLKGHQAEAAFERDYAKLKITHVDSTARVWIALLYSDDYKQCDMPLKMFRDICEVWLEFVKTHRPPEPIEVEPPYEEFGEFVKMKFPLEEAKQLMATVDSVVKGEKRHAEVFQGWAKITLTHDDMTAHMWIDPTCETEPSQPDMPLLKFRDICRDWLDFMKTVESPGPINNSSHKYRSGPDFG